jgi:hypothetical protein
MKQAKCISRPAVNPFVFFMVLGLVVLVASRAFSATPLENVQKVRTGIHNKVPVMMLSMPGRGMVLSAPKEVATVVIENSAGKSCGAFLVRTDINGVLEVPVARTPKCQSPRIVVHR